MEFGQTIRQWLRGWRTRYSAMAGAGRRGAPPMWPQAAARPEMPTHPRAGLIARACLIVALILFVVYPLYAWFYSTIDDNLAFAAAAPDN